MGALNRLCCRITLPLLVAHAAYIPILTAATAISHRFIVADHLPELKPLLYPRQNDLPDLVDPVLIPACDYNSCWHYSRPPEPICPLVDGPCADEDEKNYKCGKKQFKRDCYCGLKTGLYCAWSCNWTSWFDTEDWFEGLCPESPALKINLGAVPKCARQCLDDAMFEYGCLTQTTNCFCSHGDLFGCAAKCSKTSQLEQIARWLTHECNLDTSTSAEAIKTGSFTLPQPGEPREEQGEGDIRIVAPSLPPGKPLRWDEIFIIVVLGVTVVVGLILGVWSCFVSARK